jgi:hypothetical protein
LSRKKRVRDEIIELDGIAERDGKYMSSRYAGWRRLNNAILCATP